MNCLQRLLQGRRPALRTTLSAQALLLAALVSAPSTAARAQDLHSETVLPSIETLLPVTSTGRDFYGLHNANAADSTNANELRPGEAAGLNLTGTGVVVGVWDGGDVRASHENFRAGSVTVVDSVGLSDHATHVTGTIIGDGVPNAAARGMASDGTGASGATARSRDFANDTAELAADAAGLDLSNHSYGNVRGWDGTGAVRNVASANCQGFFGGIVTREWWFGNYSVSPTEDDLFGVYNATSVAVDNVIHNTNKLLMSQWSAGNDRNDVFVNVGGTNQWVGFFNAAPGTAVCQESGAAGGAGFYVVPAGGATVPPPSDGNGGTGYDALSNGGQTAKNVVVVGAVNDHTTDPHDGTAMTVTGFTSYGGTDDGRLAPHVVGNGAGLTSSTSGSDTEYMSFNGTSMAAPNVTGTAALLLEHWRDEGLANPKAATQKGLLIHTATDVVNGPATTGPDFATGYGMVNGRAAVGFITEAITEPPATREDHVHEETLDNGGTHTESFSALGGPVKATLVWTDPAGTATFGLDNATSVLVNELDLRIESNPTHWPWTLDITNPANAAVRTGENNVDNVEQVLIDNLAAGTNFTVFVDHDGALQGGSQQFSLLVSGAIRVPEPASSMLAMMALAAMLLHRRRELGR